MFQTLHRNKIRLKFDACKKHHISKCFVKIRIDDRCEEYLNCFFETSTFLDFYSWRIIHFNAAIYSTEILNIDYGNKNITASKEIQQS